MKKTLLSLLLLFPLLLQAQLHDNFSDGNLTHNPTWAGDTGSFVVNGQGQLQSHGPEAIGTTLQLVTPANTGGSMVWEFWAGLQLETSSGNYADIYLLSDTEDLKGGKANGYFVRLGGTPDEVSLFRKEAGKSPVYVIDGQEKTIAGKNNVLRVRVRRSADDLWELEVDVSGTGQNYVSQGKAADATFKQGSFFGLLLRYSSANNKSFYFDDFRISQAGALTLVEARPLGAQELALRFNRPLQSADAQNPAHYSLNGSMQPSAATQPAPEHVQLHFAQPFQPGTNHIRITHLTDVEGNSLPGPLEHSFTYTPAAEAPGYHELLITEVMADENPPVGLPAQEYIELYNPTGKLLSLKGIRLADATSGTTLPDVQLQPQEYAVVVPSAQKDSFAVFGKVIGVGNFPGLNNDGELLQLRRPDGRLIHALPYSDAWYKDPRKQAGGWSLEMVDVHNPCGGVENWQASTDPRGGTPAQANAVATSNPDTTPPALIAAIVQAPDLLLLRFSERLDSAQAANAASYSLSPEIAISRVTVQGPLFREVLLRLAAPLQEQQLYTLTAGRISDCAGNLSQQPLQAAVALPAVPGPGDVVINEVLFNPLPGGVDFVELVNRSDKYLDLHNWQLANTSGDSVASRRTISTQPYVLGPGQYVVLTSDPGKVKSHYPAAVQEAMLQMASLPAYPDAAGTVLVLLPDQRPADRLDYDEKMHFALLDDRNGISLERIRLEGPSTAANFHSAATTVLATPGYRNSQRQQAEGVAQVFEVKPQVFSPDGDGYEDFTTINYSTGKSGFVANITVFDAQGREVRKLVRNELLASNGFFRWDGLKEDGAKAGMGYYLFYIELFDLSGKKRAYKEEVVVAGR